MTSCKSTSITQACFSATHGAVADSPLRAVAIDICNADTYSRKLAEIYSGIVHAALMERDPVAAIRIATLFDELCSTTDRAGMRIARLSGQFAHGGAN